MVANVRSIVNKREEIQTLIAEQRPHLVALTETWLTEEVADSDIGRIHCSPSRPLWIRVRWSTTIRKE